MPTSPFVPRWKQTLLSPDKRILSKTCCPQRRRPVTFFPRVCQVGNSRPKHHLTRLAAFHSPFNPSLVSRQEGLSFGTVTPACKGAGRRQGGPRRQWKSIRAVFFVWRRFCRRRVPETTREAGGQTKESNAVGRGNLPKAVAAKRPVGHLFVHLCRVAISMQARPTDVEN